MTYVPTDEEAAFLLDAHAIEQDPAKQSQIATLLASYKQAKAASGLQPFQQPPATKRQQYEKVTKLYGGLDTMDQQLPADARAQFMTALQSADDSTEARARTVNQLFIQAQRPEAKDMIEKDWDSVKRVVAKDMLGIDKDEVTDTELYGAIGGHIQKQQAREEKANEMLGRVQEAAFAEDGDWLTAYRKYANGLDADEVPQAERDQYREIARQIHADASAKAIQYRPLAQRILVSMQRDMGTDSNFDGARGFTAEELINDLVQVPAVDRPLVYRMISLASKPGEKGAGQKVGEKFWRQVRQTAVDQVETFEQAFLADDLAAAKALDSELYRAPTPANPNRVTTRAGLLEAAGAFGQGATDATFKAMFGATPATPEEIATFRAETSQRKARYDIARELKDIAENVVDPAKFDNRFLDGIANAPGQIAYSVQAAVPVVGIALMVNGTKAMRTRELMDRGVPIEKAIDMAATSAMLEAPIEWVQSKMLFGKVPGMASALMKPLTEDTLAALGKRAAKVFAAEYALQNIQEGVQDATPLLLQEVAARFDSSIPKATADDWKAFWTERVDTAFTLLPITLIGTGAGIMDDSQFARSYIRDEKVLKASGFTPEAIDAILGRETLAEQQGMIQEMWSDSAKRVVGTPEQRAAMQDISADAQQAPSVRNIERMSDGTFEVRDESGELIDRVGTPEAAVDLLAEHEAQITRAETTAAGINPPVSGFEQSLDTEAAPLHSQSPNPPSIAMAAATDARVSAPAVIDSFSKILEAAGTSSDIRVGRFGRRKALGTYWVRSRMVRIATANDVSVAAHEVAHALEDAIWGARWRWDKLPDSVVSAAAKGELGQLGRQLYGAKVPAGGYHSEGFAEFTRLVLTDQAKAQQLAPNFMKVWIQAMEDNPAVAKAVQAAQQAGQTWFQQGAKGRAQQQIARQPSTTAKAKSAAQDFASNFQRRFIDGATAISDFVKEATNRGAMITDAENPMVTLTARRLTADSVVDYMAHKGMLDWAGNVVGDPLTEAFKLVDGKVDDFLIYLWAKRGLALWDDPRGPRNPGLDRVDAEYLVSQLESPQFIQAAGRVYKWNDQVLDYAAQASPQYAEVVAKIRTADPGFYIPLLREFEAFDDRYKGGGSAKGKSLVARLKGSGRRIKDPVESMLVHAKGIVLKAQQRAVLDQILKISESVPGMGDYVFEVPVDRIPAAAQTIQSVVDQLNRQLNPSGGGVKVTGSRMLAMNGVDLDQEVISFFAPAYQPKQNENPILPIWSGGKMRWFEMDKDLYAALSGMDTIKVSKAVNLFLNIPARAFRLGTTGLRVSFSLVTNPLRDLRTLHLNSQASGNSGKLFMEWLGMQGKLAISAVTGGRHQNDWVKLADRLGIEMAQPLGQDTKPLERAARRVKNGGAWRPYNPGDLYDFTLGLLQFTETAARLTEMKMVAKDIGWDPSMPLTPAIANHLAKVGKQVTTDFTQAGTWARAINVAVPFFNAGIQGPVAHLRALKANPQKFAVRGLMLTGLALANWYRNKDEEWWQQMSLKERYGFTYIPVGDELLRIPRSFEADGLFMAGAEALADAWHQQDPKAAGEWFARWLGGFTQLDLVEGIPTPPLPVLAEAAVQQVANRDFFSGAPIVPRSQQDMPAAEQFDHYTSRTAIKLGEILNVSPRRIDHLIRSMFGGVGGDVAGLAGRGSSELIQRDGEASDIPVLGVLFQRGGLHARNPESIESLYDAYGKAIEQSRSMRNPETLEQAQARIVLSDAVKAIAIMQDVKLYTAQRDERNAIDKEQIALAKEVLGIVERGEFNRIPGLQGKARAQELQFKKLQELGVTPQSRTSRPLRHLSTQPDETQ